MTLRGMSFSTVSTRPGRLLWLPSVLRSAGLDVVEVEGWESRGRDAISPLVLVMHHTASKASGRGDRTAPSLSIVTNGRPDLAGPLSHVLIGRDSKVYVVASGLAHNAGRGDWVATPDLDEHNGHTIAVEIENDGVGEVWSPELMLTADTVAAAIRMGMGWTTAHDADRVIGHKEWTTRKIDPNYDMPAQRARVQVIVDHWLAAQQKQSKPEPPEPPEPPTEETMSADAIARLDALEVRVNETMSADAIARLDALEVRVNDLEAVVQVTYSPEEIVTGAYKYLLGREPDEVGFDVWVAFLTGGGSVREMRDLFRMSTEYQTRNQ